MTTGRPAEIERNTIYPVPLDQRHGTARDLFTVWFGANITMLTLATGALSATVFKLPALAAFAAILVGNMVGGVFMALHAAQGPQLGVPQMVQTRGQFGAFGAIAVIALVVVMYLGFVASNLVLVGQSVHSVFRGVGVHAVIVAVSLAGVAATAFGHDLIHSFTRLLSWISGVALALCFAWTLFVHGVPADALGQGGFTQDSFTLGGFVGAVSTGALWQIAYAPYVSDYSRYLPPGLGARRAFWASYAGCVLGSVFPMALGVLLVLAGGRADVVEAFARVLGPLALIVVPVFALGMAAANALNLYCGALSTLTIVQTFSPHWSAPTRARVVVTVGLGLAATLAALLASANFMANYTDFLLLLLYVLVPWTAINLVDYYLVKHGDYEVADFFRMDGGRYGRFNRAAILCYVAGVLIQIPFIANSLYTGPVARMLGGTDISWIVGLAVIGPLYWALARVGIGADAKAAVA